MREFATSMDCRVKPGNDTSGGRRTTSFRPGSRCFLSTHHLMLRSRVAASRSMASKTKRPLSRGGERGRSVTFGSTGETVAS